MREIKFRGKRVDDGEWVYGYYVKQKILNVLKDRYEHKIYDDCLQIHTVHLDTVGQYTGLKDIDGAEIYEGDIVKGIHTTVIHAGTTPVEIGASSIKWKGVVEWVQDCCSYGVRESACRHSKMLKCHEYEIIGNIHENPELLEAK